MQYRRTARKCHCLLLAAHAIHTLINLPSLLKSGYTVKAQLHNLHITCNRFTTYLTENTKFVTQNILCRFGSFPW